MVRDGVEVAMSLKTRENQKRTMENCKSRLSSNLLSEREGFALWNTYIDEEEVFFSGINNENFLEVRYEDLLAEPSREVKRIMNYLSINNGIDEDLSSRVKLYERNYDLDDVFLQEILNNKNMKRFGYSKKYK